MYKKNRSLLGFGFFNIGLTIGLFSDAGYLQVKN